MTDVLATDLRQEEREQLILCNDQLDISGSYLRIEPHSMTAVKTVCFWLRNELELKQVSLGDLCRVLDDPTRRLLFFSGHTGSNIEQIEAACRQFANAMESVVDLLVNIYPNLEVHA